MSPELASRLGPKALEAEQARLARFFTSIEKHRNALELAIEESFEGVLDAMSTPMKFVKPSHASAARCPS